MSIHALAVESARLSFLLVRSLRPTIHTVEIGSLIFETLVTGALRSSTIELMGALRILNAMGDLASAIPQKWSAESMEKSI